MSTSIGGFSKAEHGRDETLAAQLRGFGPIGIGAMLIILLPGNLRIGEIVILPAGALLVLAWTWLSRTPWRRIGYVRQRSWMLTVAGGIACGVAFKLAMKAMVMPLLGADAVNHAYHFLSGNTAALPGAIWAMAAAGFGEETVFRGYLFERSEALFGRSARATAWTVAGSAAFFGAAHLADQGLPGAEQGAIVGIVFGTAFALSRNIVPLMIAHTAFDLTALAIIYWGLETKIGHWIF